MLITGIGGTGKTDLARASLEGAEFTEVVATGLDADRDLGAFDHLIEPRAELGTATDALREHLGDGALLVINAHLLDDRSIRLIDQLVRRGVRVVVTSRPTPRAELSHLRDRFEASGSVIEMGPLDIDDLAAALATATGRAVDAEMVASLHRAGAGILRWAKTALIDSDGTGILAEVRRELAAAGDGARAVAEVLAVAEGAPDDVVASTADVEIEALSTHIEMLRVAGLIDTATGDLVPAVSTAVADDLAPVDRRALHRRIAEALQVRGTEPLAAAEHLREAGVADNHAAEIYRRAGDGLRFRDPEAALGWYALAASTGSEPDPATMAGIAEASLFGGAVGIDLNRGQSQWTADLQARATAVEAVSAARAGRTGRCTDLLLELHDHPAISAELARFLAEPGAVATGAAPAASQSADSAPTSSTWAYRLAQAVVPGRAAGFTADLIEACELFERWEPSFIPPDTPHAIAALTFIGESDLRASESVLDRAERSEAGGPAFQTRQRLLQAWTHMRQSRYERALLVLDSTDSVDLAGRDQLVLAALQSAVARRSGDVPRMRAAWASAEPVLIAGIGDLFHHELLGELLLVAIRLRDEDRAGVLLGTLRSWVDSLGPDHSWRIPHAWLEVQVAVETDDEDRLATAVEQLEAEAGTRARDVALLEAGRAWMGLIRGDITVVDDMIDTADALEAADLAWEGSRLVGRAALDQEAPADARRLLEAARRLHRSPVAEDAAPSTVGLTEREVELARYLIDGHTYKEIGAAMYISPKTVEHHVARIRRKLQAESRAEMLATLREQLEPISE